MLNTVNSTLNNSLQNIINFTWSNSFRGRPRKIEPKWKMFQSGIHWSMYGDGLKNTKMHPRWKCNLGSIDIQFNICFRKKFNVFRKRSHKRGLVFGRSFWVILFKRFSRANDWRRNGCGSAELMSGNYHRWYLVHILKCKLFHKNDIFIWHLMLH